MIEEFFYETSGVKWKKINLTHILGEANLTTHMLAEWVNETLGLSGDDEYSAGKIDFICPNTSRIYNILYF